MTISLGSLHGSRAAELRDVQISGLPGIGCYTLVLNLKFTSTHPQSEVIARNISVRLEWGGNEQRMIAAGTQEGAPAVHITPHSPDFQIGFRLPLSAPQIEAIESLRNGGDFKLALWLFGESEQDKNFSSIAGRHEFAVRQQEWIETLERMNYSRNLLFELPLPSVDSPIEKLIIKGKSFLNKGEYEQTVALCRQAIEKIETLLNDKSAASRAIDLYREDRKSMDTTQRLLFLREALKNVTHLAVHHTEGHGGYSRDQAKTILGTTISLLSLFGPLVEKNDNQIEQ